MLTLLSRTNCTAVTVLPRISIRITIRLCMAMASFEKKIDEASWIGGKFSSFIEEIKVIEVSQCSLICEEQSRRKHFKGLILGKYF